MEPYPWDRRIHRSSYVEHLRAQQVARRDVAVVLREAAKEAEAMAARLIPDPGVGAQIRASQAQVLSYELRVQQGQYWGEITRTTRQNMDRAANAAVQGNARLAEYLARAGASNELASQFTLAAMNSGRSVRAKYMNNIQLSPRVYRNQQVLTARVNRIVARGLAQNLSAREMASSVKGFISPATPGGVNYAAMRLARTEINNAFHGINTELHDELPFVEGVKWELSGSHPRPDECDDLADDDHDGLGPGVFRPANVPMKPHPHCLCDTYPISLDAEQFATNLANGRYDSWLRSQGYSGIAA